MRKLWNFTIGILICLLFCSCQKKVDAEVILVENNQESIFTISVTEDKAKIKEIFQHLQYAKTDISFSGAKIELNLKADGDLTIQSQEPTTVDVSYTMMLDIETNFRKYISKGALDFSGSTKTKSENLEINTNQKISGNIWNDDSFLYFDGSYELDSSKVKTKKKLDISSFTNQYKGYIISCLDFLKYQKLMDFIPDFDSLIDSYVVAISKTTKNSFTLQCNVPIDNHFVEWNVVVSTETLLPIKFSISLDRVLIEQLEKEYREKYSTEEVKVNQASFTIEIQIKYGNYIIEELSENDKLEYGVL